MNLVQEDNNITEVINFNDNEYLFTVNCNNVTMKDAINLEIFINDVKF